MRGLSSAQSTGSWQQVHCIKNQGKKHQIWQFLARTPERYPICVVFGAQKGTRRCPVASRETSVGEFRRGARVRVAELVEPVLVL